MTLRPASLGVGLLLVLLALSGCFQQPGDGVFGPASGLDVEANNSPALSLQASPARGPSPLLVEFSLSAKDRDGDPLAWSLDFGDETAPAEGNDLPARPRHTYRVEGSYVATFTVVQGEEDYTSRISIVVLEGVVSSTGTPSPTQGPEPPPTPPPSSSSSSSSDTGSVSDTPTPTPTPTSSTSSSTAPGNTTTDTSTAAPPSSTSSSTSASTSDSGTTSSTGTETFSEPSSSTSASDTGTSDPSSSTSESQTSTDPPL